MAKVPQYQIRKVFDPRTMSVVEEFVQTGVIEVDEGPEPEAATAPEAEPAPAPAPPTKKKNGIVAKAKKRRGKKKSDA